MVIQKLCKQTLRYFTEYHIQKNEEAMISLALQDLSTYEEIKEQFARSKERKDEFNKLEAPFVRKKISRLQLPLKFKDIVAIYKGFIAKQITLEIIPEEVLNEFKKTRQYESLRKRKYIE